MARDEHDGQDETETPAEPVTDDDDEAAEQEEAEQTPEPAPAPVEEEPTPEEQMHALAAGLKRERTLHAKRLGTILGDASTETLPCPLCFEGLQGFLHPGSAEELTDDQRQAALAFLGIGGGDTLEPAEGVERCSRCKGKGQLAYPTDVPHVQQQTCPRCGGNGYTPEGQTAATPGLRAVEAVTAPPAAANGAGPCPLCGAPGMAGQPHWCQPVAAAGV